MGNNYVSVVYDEKRTPRTDYPSKLAAYLFKRFDMKKGEKFLEIGCGRGEYLQAFQELGLICYGTDLNNYPIEKGADNVKHFDASKDRFPFEDDSFDIVYHKSLIEHLYSPEHLMKETLRILKPGGRIIILTPDWVSQMKVFYEDYTHSRPYDRTSLGDLLRVFNVREVQTELFYQLPVLWRYPFLKVVSSFLRFFIPTQTARALTNLSRMKFIRWSVELMVLATGKKEQKDV